MIRKDLEKDKGTASSEGALRRLRAPRLLALAAYFLHPSTAATFARL